MSTRLPVACCVKATLTPPARMKLPSCTARTRSLVGSKISVSVIVDSRCAPVIDSATVYGPPPTRNVGLGGEIRICAPPTPGDVVGTAAGCVPGAGAGVAAGGVAAGGVAAGGVAAGGVG